MAAMPASPVPSISPGEMQILVSRAGLLLNPGQVADLVLAWRQVAGLIAGIPHGRPLADDFALSFRLPPPANPASAGEASGNSAGGRAVRKRRPSARKAPAKAKVPAKASKLRRSAKWAPRAKSKTRRGMRRR